MFTDFLRRLTGSRLEEPLPELDGRLAVGALLVRLAKADAHYAVEEIARIDRILAERYGLNPVEAAKMRATCEKLEAQAPDTGAFTRLVQQGVGYDERAAVYDAMWQVSLADGTLRPEETELLEKVGTALAITETDDASLKARYLG